MEEILIIDDSKQICAMLAEYVLPELGYVSAIANTGRQGLNRLRQRLPDLILLDLQLPDISGLDLLRLIAQEGYDVPVILMTAHGSEAIAVEAFRLGARNYLIKPFSETEAQGVIDNALRERRLAREKDALTRNLRQRVQELTVLYSIGKSVSSLLDLEEVLVRIVEAGVYITRAEEGFLLLRDPHADELYLRAAKNLGEQRAQRLRMPIDDGIAGQVVRTGKPIRLDKASAGTSLKIKTGFLVRAILQVPLTVGNTVIGVLAVDNQQAERTFSENDQYLLSALADYAAIAIENARLYEQVKTSETRYRDLFANAYDLIFSLDRELHITSINKVGPELIGYSETELVGRALEELSLPESWPIAQRQLANLMIGRSIQPFELQLVREDHRSHAAFVRSRQLLRLPAGETDDQQVAGFGLGAACPFARVAREGLYPYDDGRGLATRLTVEFNSASRDQQRRHDLAFGFMLSADDNQSARRAVSARKANAKSVARSGLPFDAFAVDCALVDRLHFSTASAAARHLSVRGAAMDAGW